MQGAFGEEEEEEEEEGAFIMRASGIQLLHVMV